MKAIRPLSDNTNLAWGKTTLRICIRAVALECAETCTAYCDQPVRGLRVPCTPTHIGGSYQLIELFLRPAYSYGIYRVPTEDTQ